MQGEKMKYLIKYRRIKKSVVHLWTGEDTICKMYSTGGLKVEDYKVSETPENRNICQNCLNVQAQNQFVEPF